MQKSANHFKINAERCRLTQNQRTTWQIGPNRAMQNVAIMCLPIDAERASTSMRKKPAHRCRARLRIDAEQASTSMKSAAVGFKKRCRRQPERHLCGRPLGGGGWLRGGARTARRCAGATPKTRGRPPGGVPDAANRRKVDVHSAAKSAPRARRRAALGPQIVVECSTSVPKPRQTAAN